MQLESHAKNMAVVSRRLGSVLLICFFKLQGIVFKFYRCSEFWVAGYFRAALWELSNWGLEFGWAVWRWKVFSQIYTVDDVPPSLVWHSLQPKAWLQTKLCCTLEGLYGSCRGLRQVATKLLRIMSPPPTQSPSITTATEKEKKSCDPHIGP